jgi:hypothetical protein
MKRCPPFKLWTATIAVLLVTFVAGSAFAQAQSGNIYGKVQAKDGSALPGVTVSLTGVGAPQQFVTDATGTFRFLGLSPGVYAVKAELASFGSSTRNGISVNIGRSADVTLTLNPSASEAITVTAEAPLLDVRKTGTGSNVSKVELENIPTARDPWVILQQTPGVTMDRNNVGGNESGQQSVYVSKGTAGTQATWNVDGVNITDFAATGSSPAYYDFDSFEEMQIATGGSDPRIMTPGVQLNMVTKRGTNDIKGSARAFSTRKAWQAEPRIPSEAAGYLTGINEINGISDDGGEIGGPIVRDKLWFWGAFAKNNIDILTPTVINGVQFRDRTTLKNENLKLNAQPLASNSLTLVDQYGAKIKLGRNVSTARPPASAWNQNDTYAHGTGSLKDPTLWKIEDTQILGKNLYLTGLYSKVQGGFQLIADNGVGCQSFACGVNISPAWYDEHQGAWQRSYESIQSLRPQKQYRLDGSAFADTGKLNHELKFGAGHRNATVTSSSAWPGGQWTDNYAIDGTLVGPKGSGDTGFVHFTRFPNSTYFAKSDDAYLGDTLLMGNLTLTGSVRYDKQQGGVTAGTAPADPTIPTILQAISFPAVSGLKWTNISPRIGMTYALGSDRRTLLRASYNRYVNQLNSGAVTAVSPGAYAEARYYFKDLNGDNVAQNNEIDFAAGPVIPLPSNVASVARTRWDPDLKAPYTDELLVGGEREVMTNLVIGIDGTYRKLQNFFGTYGEHTQGGNDLYTSADYHLSPSPLTNVTLPNGEAVAPVNYYVLNAGVTAPRFFVIRNTPDYYETYRGLDFTATKRMANRWMMRGNFTLQDWKRHVGSGAIVDPTQGQTCGICNGADVLIQSTGSGAKGNVYINSKWTYSVNGLYQIPVIETAFGINVNGRQGYALPYIATVRTNTGEGTKSILVAPSSTSFRNQNVQQVDMRLAKDVRFRRAAVTFSLDGFNMLNSNTILQRNVGALCTASMTASSSTPAGKCNATSTANRVFEVLSPRVFRLGARLSF